MLHLLSNFLQQVLHIVLGMQGTVTNQSNVWVNKLQLTHFFVITRASSIESVKIKNHIETFKQAAKRGALN